MSLEGIRVLLVDDERRFVETLAERLSMRGLVPRVAHDGPQALEAVTRPVDVIVLDLRMPGMDGFEVLRKVKASNPQVQVIILTGHGGACGCVRDVPHSDAATCAPLSRTVLKRAAPTSRAMSYFSFLKP